MADDDIFGILVELLQGVREDTKRIAARQDRQDAQIAELAKTLKALKAQSDLLPDLFEKQTATTTATAKDHHQKSGAVLRVIADELTALKASVAAMEGKLRDQETQRKLQHGRLEEALSSAAHRHGELDDWTKDLSTKLNILNAAITKKRGLFS